MILNTRQNDLQVHCLQSPINSSHKTLKLTQPIFYLEIIANAENNVDCEILIVIFVIRLQTETHQENNYRTTYFTSFHSIIGMVTHFINSTRNESFLHAHHVHTALYQAAHMKPRHSTARLRVVPPDEVLFNKSQKCIYG